MYMLKVPNTSWLRPVRHTGHTHAPRASHCAGTTFPTRSHMGPPCVSAPGDLRLGYLTRRMTPKCAPHHHCHSVMTSVHIFRGFFLFGCAIKHPHDPHIILSLCLFHNHHTFSPAHPSGNWQNSICMQQLAIAMKMSKASTTMKQSFAIAIDDLPQNAPKTEKKRRRKSENTQNKAIYVKPEKSELKGVCVCVCDQK